ncbi:MAG: PucR family transcriptional regulator [Anaerolineae bacterium]
MPLTVADALRELPVFSQAWVVAGKQGLQRVIRWAHVVDIPDVAPWVRGGDLLLTTAFALRDNPSMQAELIPSLVERGLSGMVVAVGRYFRQIPPEMASLADELDFPIIALPFEVPFVEVTRAIHERVLNEQHALLQQSLRIHKVLTQLVVEGKGLDALAEGLASLLNRGVTIEDSSLRLLAHASAGPADEVRERTVAEGQTPREISSYLASQGLFECLKADPRPRHVPPIPALGMTLERVVAPILVGTQLYGYVWIIATCGPLTELDFLTIERAATVAALIMSREQAIHEAEQRLKAGPLENLLDPDPYQAIRAVADTLRRLGLDQGYQILVLEDASGLARPTLLCRLVKECAGAQGLRATAIERGQRIVVLLGNVDPQGGLDLAHALVEAGTKQGFALTLGLSTASHQATGVRQCYQEATEALQVGMALSDRGPGVWRFEDLGILHWLRALPSEAHSASRYSRVVQEMAEHDRERGTQFLKTLEVYIECLGNAQQAAERLFVHRNTLRHRLSRIREAWDVDLDDAYTLLNLFAAIKGWRLRGGV